MFKRRHSLKTFAGAANEEKKRRRWTQCVSHSLQKLALATGLYYSKTRNKSYEDCFSETVARIHPTLKRTDTDQSDNYNFEQAPVETCNRKFLHSVDSDVSLTSRLDLVDKVIECPLNDAQLQRDIARVVERLNYLLNLTENGNDLDDMCQNYENTIPLPNMDCGNSTTAFEASWEEATSSLWIKLIPGEPKPRTTSTYSTVPRLERLDSGLGNSVTSSIRRNSPGLAHRELSASTSSDSGYYNHQNDVISPSDDNEKRPPSPNIAALNKVGKNKKLTREFRPISEITGTRTCPNKDIVKRWTKIPPYGVPINNDEALAQELETIDQWGGLDVFKLARLSNNRPLTCVMYTICKKRDMFKKFKLEPDKFLTYIMTLEDHYRDVSYHNRIHAADVVQSVHSLLSIPSLKDLFSDLEVLSALIASAIHDVDHPGVSNQYHCANYTELALLYNDTSVLEMHHLAVGFKLMMQEHCNLFEHFSRKQWQLFRKMVIDMVLATDMSKHMQLVANLKTMVETKKVASSGVLELDQYTDRIEVLKNLVHCADLSNPIKPLDMYKQWTNRIMEEYWVQGDIERDLGAEISPMCDRYNANVEKSQVMFIDFVVYPLVEIWAELVSPHAQSMLIALTNNREYYASLMPGSPSPVSEKKENWEKEEKVIEEDLIAEVVLEETVNITTEQDSPSSSSSPKERSSLSKWLFSDKTRAGKS